MPLSRRSFLKHAAITPLAIPTLVASMVPAEETAAVFETYAGRWANGVPFFTGFKAAQLDNRVAGQLLVSWNPLLPLGAKIEGRLCETWYGRQVLHQMFYSNVILYLEELNSPPEVVSALLKDRICKGFTILRQCIRGNQFTSILDRKQERSWLAALHPRSSFAQKAQHNIHQSAHAAIVGRKGGFDRATL